MKVRLTLDVSDGARYVIAKYFAVAANHGTADRERLRATRDQVRRFARGMFAAGVKQQGAALPKRQRSVAKRLTEATTQPSVDVIELPSDATLDLPFA